MRYETRDPALTGFPRISIDARNPCLREPIMPVGELPAKQRIPPKAPCFSFVDSQSNAANLFASVAY